MEVGDIKKIFNKNNIILSVSSVTAGVLNGFAGTGGGIILYLILKFLSKTDKGSNPNPGSGNIKDLMAAIISAVTAMSAVSSIVYMAKGKIVYTELPTYLPAALIGGIIGACLLEKLKFKIVKKLFAAMIIYAGIKMILK